MFLQEDYPFPVGGVAFSDSSKVELYNVLNFHLQRCLLQEQREKTVSLLL